MRTANRIEYDSYLPLSEQTDDLRDLTATDKLLAELEARGQHLCALGFMLAHFNPYKMAIGDDEAIAFQNYGRLIRDISEGLFTASDGLERLLDAATTFAEPENCTNPP